jgi:hypothetical protein
MRTTTKLVGFSINAVGNTMRRGYHQYGLCFWLSVNVIHWMLEAHIRQFIELQLLESVHTSELLLNRELVCGVRCKMSDQRLGLGLCAAGWSLILRPHFALPLMPAEFALTKIVCRGKGGCFSQLFVAKAARFQVQHSEF